MFRVKWTALKRAVKHSSPMLRAECDGNLSAPYIDFYEHEI